MQLPIGSDKKDKVASLLSIIRSYIDRLVLYFDRMPQLFETHSPTVTRVLANLRAIFKASKMRAEDLADALNVSEPTVWRWLRGDGLTLDRLDAICQILGVEMGEAFEIENDDVAEMFTLAQERVLAADRSLALLFFAILHGSQAAEISETFKLTDQRLTHHLERLERLGLVTRTRRGRMKATVRRSVRWHRGGPLSQAFNKTVKHFFLSLDFGDPKSEYVSDMVEMNAAGRAHVLALFEKVREEIHLISEKERNAKIQSREWSGVLMMTRPLNIDELTREWSDAPAPPTNNL